MKKVLIPWSGGLDSTYLVWKNLSEGNEVYTFSVQLENNVGQRDSEIAARKLMREYFTEKFPICNLYEDHDLSKIGVRGGYNMLLNQPPIWILFSMYSHDLCNVEEIQIGYVMNDDAISYLDEIRNLYSSYSSFLNCKPPKLQFPLIKKKKYDLINEMPEELVKMVSYCEYGSDPNCNCLCCERHHAELRLSHKYNLARPLPYVYDSEKKVEVKPIAYQTELPFVYEEETIEITD